MTTTDEYRQKLVAELIEQSANIDTLVIKSRQAVAIAKPAYDRQLEELRAKHFEITTKLQAIQESSSNAWENIGDGG